METNQEYNCTFCGLNKHQVKILIGGQTTSYICDICVQKCYDLISNNQMDFTPEDDFDDFGDDVIPSPTEIREYLDQYIIGQDEAKITVSVAAYNHYKRILNPEPDGVELDKSNILLVGPTGSGKTLIAQSLAKFLDVPWVIADATSLTEAGYVGEDVETIIGRLLAAADFDVSAAERGIVFLDEIDKKRAARSANSQRDVSGEGVQQALLKLLEGTELLVSPPGKKNGDRIKVNTKNILFIVSGAFVGLDKIMNKEGKAIGFGASSVDARLSEKLKAEHLIEFGLIPEMVGRLPVIGVLEELDEQQLFHVLTEPKNAITKQFKALFSLDGVELEFTEDSLLVLARKAISNKTGARGLRGMIEAALLHTQYKLPDMRDEGAEKITVTKEVFENGSAPEVKYAQK